MRLRVDSACANVLVGPCGKHGSIGMGKREHTQQNQRAGRLQMRLVAWGLVLGVVGCTGNNVDPPRTPEEREPTTLNLDGTFRAEATVRPQAIRRDSAPVSLVSQDGAALELRSLLVRADLERPLAFTELEMEFANPEGRALDARLSVQIPPGARVTRFAVNRKGHWKDAEVVPRKAAYQNLVKERHDPALVSASAGEQFRARVFPVEAHGRTRIIVSYLHEIGTGSQTYRVPLAGLDSKLDVLMIRIHGAGLKAVQGSGRIQRQQQEDMFILRDRNVVPGKDVVVEYTDNTPLGLRHDNMFVARFSPVHHDHNAPVESLTILFDTSASQALDYQRHVARLEQVVQSLRSRTPNDFRLRVVAFDQTARTVFNGKVSKFGQTQLKDLRRRRPLGASDLAGALRFVSSRSQKKFKRVLLMTDGVVTGGATEATALEREVKKLRRNGVSRLDVMVEGGLHDQNLLRGLVSHHLARSGLVLPPGTSPDLAVRKMLRSVTDGINVKIPNTNWVYPQQLSGVQHGDEVVVFADLRDEQAQRVRVTLDGPIQQTQRLEVVEAKESLLAAAWNAAKVQWTDQNYRDCLTTGDELCPLFRERILDVSTEHRILNDYTALVMLADDDKHKRFGLARDTPVSFLTVTGQGVVSQRRMPIDTEVAPQVGERRGLPVRTHAVSTDFRLQEQPWDDVLRARAAASQALPASNVVADGSSKRRVVRPEAFKPVGAKDVSAVVEKLVPKREESTTPEPSTKPARTVGPVRRPGEAYDGMLLSVMKYLEWGKTGPALRLARDWRDAEPDNVVALVALGRALEANGRRELAARAYGSIIDLYPSRPDMRRFAAQQLEGLDMGASWLVIDSYARALELRSDDPSSFRMLGYALLKAEYYQAAFDTLVHGLAWARADSRRKAIARILAEDLGLFAAAWLKNRPGDREIIERNIEVHNVALPTQPSVRFVLSWETAASDVDLHIRDGGGWHAYHKNPALESGGNLYGDIKDGIGLEAFVIDGEPTAYPYYVQVEYFTNGPMGFGMGKVQIVEHDGEGGLKFDERPYVVTRDRAYVDLGAVLGPI